VRKGLLAAMRQLADGHWVLAFSRPEDAAKARDLVQKHAAKLRAMYTDVLPTAGVHSAAVAAPPAAQQQPHHAGDGLAFGSVLDARGGSTAAGAAVEVGGVCPGSSASDGGSAPAATSATGESAAAAHADAVAAPAAAAAAAAAAAEVEQLPSPVAAGRGEGEASAAAAVHAVLDALVTAAERSEGDLRPAHS
jgi:hypothetical protein